MQFKNICFIENFRNPISHKNNQFLTFMFALYKLRQIWQFILTYPSNC